MRSEKSLEMKAFSVLLTLILVAVHHGAAEVISRRGPLANNNLLTSANLRTFRRVQRNLSCPKNICFALDGSEAVSRQEYGRIVSFAQVVAAIIRGDERSQFAAVQYGLRNIEIASLGRRGFLRSLGRSRAAGAQRTFTSAGLGFCINELRGSLRESSVIVIGDGRSNFGTDPRLLVERFFNDDMRLVSVGVGFGSQARLRESLGGRDNVISLNDYSSLQRSVVRVVRAACSS